MAKINWNDFPTSPRRFPFFYGWVIVAGSILAILASIPGQTMGMGVFTEFLMRDLGLKEIQLSSAYMIGTLASGALLPMVGQFIDRVGTRVVVVLAAWGLAGALCALALSTQVKAWAPEGSVIIPFAFITLCFLLVRLMGQGSLTMVSKVVIGKWFNHRRGLATGICGLFVSFGFNGSPIFLNNLVEWFTWRGACFYMAAILAFGVAAAGWWIYRDRPEDCGLVMDGIRDPDRLRQLAKTVPDTRKEFTRGEALRTFPFWVFSIGVGSQGLLITALTFHIAALGAENGLDRNTAFALFLPTAYFAVCANFFGGWISDRIRLKYMLMVMMIAQTLYTIGAMNLYSPMYRALFTFGYGVSGGLFGVIGTVTWPRFYGREHLGAISGVYMSVIVIASALGPVFFSVMRGWTGSFLMVLAVTLLIPLGVLIGSIAAENPQESLPETAVTV